MKEKIKIAVVGIGLMGSQHLKALSLSKRAKLHSIVDLNKSYTIKDTDMAYKCRWTPFHGKKVKGDIFATIINGKIKMINKKILGKPNGKVVLFNK